MAYSRTHFFREANTMAYNTFYTKRWVEIALINFCIVATAGLTMRYKIKFALPVVNQKYLMHAHSNFAFTGWVSVALMTLMVRYLVRNRVVANYRKYNWIIGLNVATAYPMFVFFMLQGYDFWSNTFLIISILISYFFIYFFWIDLRKFKANTFSANWLRAALIVWGFSSLGAFLLAYLLANHIMIQDLYFWAIYFFLHFQYNGWFLFVCFGIFFAYMQRLGLLQVIRDSKRLFWVMVITVVPTYFLSIIWLKLPPYLHWIADISAILQLLVLLYFIRILVAVKQKVSYRLHKSTRWLWMMASIAFMMKVVLQVLSIIPYLSHFAFGFRPVIIGYLHLSFVGIISLFIFGYINEFIHRFRGKVSGIGAIIFVVGFIIQEFILMLQGLEAMNVEPIKSANIILFYCAVLMVIGLIWITVGIMRTQEFELETRRVPKKMT